MIEDLLKIQAVLLDCERLLKSHDSRNAALHRAEVIYSPLTGSVVTELRRVARMLEQLDSAEEQIQLFDDPS